MILVPYSEENSNLDWFYLLMLGIDLMTGFISSLLIFYFSYKRIREIEAIANRIQNEERYRTLKLKSIYIAMNAICCAMIILTGILSVIDEDYYFSPDGTMVMMCLTFALANLECNFQLMVFDPTQMIKRLTNEKSKSNLYSTKTPTNTTTKTPTLAGLSGAVPQIENI